MTIVLLAVHVLTNVPLAQFLKVTSIQLIPISVLNVAHVLTLAPAVLSHCNQQSERKFKSIEKDAQAAPTFFVLP